MLFYVNFTSLIALTLHTDYCLHYLGCQNFEWESNTMMWRSTFKSVILGWNMSKSGFRYIPVILFPGVCLHGALIGSTDASLLMFSSLIYILIRTRIHYNAHLSFTEFLKNASLSQPKCHWNLEVLTVLTRSGLFKKCGTVGTLSAACKVCWVI